MRCATLHVLGGLIAATLFMEVGLDLIEASPLWRVLPVAEIAPYGPDPETGYRHRPNVGGVWLTEHRARIKTSALGLRDRDRPPEKSGTPRGIVLGNSLIEALQVPQSKTAIAIAEQILDQTIPGAEVINLGLAGATPPVDVVRLRSVGLPLKPDVAVIVLASNELRKDVVYTDNKAPGYRRGLEGRLAVSFAFRDTPGFRFRSSAAGQAIYWSIDHSSLARLINNRKNVGLFAEWPGIGVGATAAAGPTATCNEPELAQAASLWIDGFPEADREVRDAFLRDLGETAHRNKLRVVLALRGIATGCPQWQERRAAIIAAARDRITAMGVLFDDFDRRVADLARGDVTRLYGFGPHLGAGHLNIAGNRVWGEALAAIIGEALAAPLPQ
jgi:hypothetical protein